MLSTLRDLLALNLAPRRLLIESSTADATVALHNGIDVGAPVLASERVEDGEAVEFRFAGHRGDTAASFFLAQGRSTDVMGIPSLDT